MPPHPSQLTHSLDESHSHIKQLTLLLSEKKEAILKYQEQVSDLQAEVGGALHSSQSVRLLVYQL